MRRTIALALGAFVAACGGGGGGEDDVQATVLFADVFDGPLPGDWALFGDVAIDTTTGAPAPSLRLGGGGGSSGVAVTNDAFPTAGGLTVSLRFVLDAGGVISLDRADGSEFVGVRIFGGPPNNLFVTAAGAVGSASVPLDGALHALEVRVAPGAGAVEVLVDGGLAVDNSAPVDPPADLRLDAVGDPSAAIRIDQVLVTTP